MSVAARDHRGALFQGGAKCGSQFECKIGSYLYIGQPRYTVIPEQRALPAASPYQAHTYGSPGLNLFLRPYLDMRVYHGVFPQEAFVSQDGPLGYGGILLQGSLPAENTAIYLGPFSDIGIRPDYGALNQCSLLDDTVVAYGGKFVNMNIFLKMAVSSYDDRAVYYCRSMDLRIVADPDILSYLLSGMVVLTFFENVS